MELQACNIFALFVVVVTLSVASSLPASRTDDVLQEASGLALNKRPKYMDTRRDLDVFKDLVLISIQELVDENRLNPALLPEEDAPKPVEKRMRYMGICMKKQYNNFIPFPCLRSGR
ncbi:whitnin precursor [Aplysia californica]|uniref:Whitnin n=1 Tax=Aplysia californica TaxID=6500 RepID=Q5PSJ3_APLCA|nr:whitnin precursor [Aplysia californica]AAV84472.1 whitnin precursor [Aplysia californica]